MFRYTYNTLVYGREPIAIGIERVARAGYDGVELVGEPADVDSKEISAALSANGGVASSIISIFTPERDIVSSTAATRQNALDYVKGNIDYAAGLGAEIVTFTPTACMKIVPETTLDQEWDWAIAAATELADYAGTAGMRIVLEPWNRYETYLITRTQRALEFIDQVGSPNLAYMVDTFHMSIEETDIAESIRLAGAHVGHVHLADSNRAAPGFGHLDFEPIIAAIAATDYKGWISYELLPAAGDVWGVLDGAGAPEFKGPYTEAAIKHTKAIVAKLGLD
jgi:sugar phosphate isomerase/epimerase